ncbi:MAG: hypothetical protein KAJ51_14155, partial [Thermoplasmata archaeon]|nr:hypothetical protein [Thermoplasmata archaeon]
MENNYKLKLMSKFSVLILLLMVIGLFLPNTATAQTDSDGDGLTDDLEIEKGSYHDDADSDDDGIIDGQEVDWDVDTDDDGLINARDPDSDNDGIKDGTEQGRDDSNLNEDTDIAAGNFVIDDDNTSTTDPTNWDSDGDGISDGDEDKNKDGEWDEDEGETNPNFADTDGDGIENSVDLDDDGDGMPDKWENRESAETGQKYGDPLVNDANVDNDKDGISNYKEFLGDDGVDGPVDDSSDPWDPLSVPNTPPVVDFRPSKLVLEGDEEKLFDETVVSVSDAEGGPLKYIWDFNGDGINDTTQRNSLDIVWTYQVGEYNTKLVVTDEKGQMGSDTIAVTVLRPVGENGTIYPVKPSEDAFKHPNKTVRKKWYIAYKLTDVNKDDEITIELTVTSGTGVRIFILNEKDFNRYRYNHPDEEGQKVSKVYDSGWKGINALTRDEDYTWKVPDDPKHGNVYIVVDNGYYKEYLKTEQEVTPATYHLEITRVAPMWGIIFLVIGIVAVVVVIIVVAIYFGRKREKSISRKMTKEAAVETQKTLDREMARLEAEIQESLIKSGPLPPQAMQGAPPPMAATTTAPVQPAAMPSPAGGPSPGPGPPTPIPAAAPPAAGAPVPAP